MRFWLVLIYILLSCSSVIWSSDIPYPTSLKPSVQSEFNNYSRLLATDVKLAHQFAFALNQQTHDQPDPNLKKWGLLIYCNSLIEVDSITKSRDVLTQFNQSEWQNSEDWILALKHLVAGQLAVFKADYKRASVYFKSGLELVSDKGHPKLESQLMQGLADNYRYQGKYDLSLNKWYEALRFSEKLADSAEIISCYSGRGIVRFIQDDYDKASEDIDIMFGYYKRFGNKKYLAYGYSLKALLSNSAGNNEQAIQLALKSYELRKSIGDIKGQGESLNNLALAHMGLKHWGQALRYLEEAVQLKTWANDQSELPIILNNIGHCHQRLGDKYNALKYFEMALTRAKSNGQYDSVLRAYRNIMKLQASNGNHQEAFGIQSEMYRLKDSLKEAEKAETITDLEVKYETEKKEQEILLLQKNKDIVTNRWLTLALGLFLAIIIGILFIDNQKRKHREEKMLMVAEDERQKSELRKMSDLLESNKNKLSIYTENLLKKTELVGELESRLMEIKDASEVSAKGKKLVDDFSSVRILTDEDWSEFKRLFDGVHSGFLEKLLAKYPELTLGDQRLILLMKLTLTSREIANILGVSPDSVKKSRYRLRKKLGLSEAKTLQLFVNEFQ